MGMHVRKGDTVYIRTGKDKGRTAKVMSVSPTKGNCIVEGCNMVSKRLKPSQANPQGGILQKEMPIDLSNVAPVDKNGKPTRVRFETKPDGTKLRVAATTGEQIGVALKKASK